MVGAFGFEASENLGIGFEAFSIEAVFFELSGEGAALDLVLFAAVVGFHNLDDFSYAAVRGFGAQG